MIRYMSIISFFPVLSNFVIKLRIIRKPLHVLLNEPLWYICSYSFHVGKKEIEVIEAQRGALKVGQIVQDRGSEVIPSLEGGADEDTFIEQLPQDGGPLGTYVLSQAVKGTKVFEDVQLGGFAYGPFRSLFSHRTREDMAMEFTDYLTQRLGGQNNYAHNHEERGPNLASSLLAVHHHINIDIATAQRWLNHMDATLEDLEDEIDAET